MAAVFVLYWQTGSFPGPVCHSRAQGVVAMDGLDPVGGPGSAHPCVLEWQKTNLEIILQSQVKEHTAVADK
jgi:hypothetical protein